MSNGIAPLPSGIGIAVIAEHRPRGDQQQHRDPERESAADETVASDAPRQPERHPIQTAAAAPLLDEPGVPAETLFAAALMANRLLPQTPSAEEFLLRQHQEWAPPESGLRLKDKLI